MVNVVGKCPICGADGIPGFEDTYVCECFNTPAWIEYLTSRTAAIKLAAKIATAKTGFMASLPKRYEHYVVNDVPAEISRQNAAVIHASNDMIPGKFLYLYGPSGVGKTHIAIRTAARLISTTGFKGAYIGEVAYFDALTASFNGGTPPPDLQKYDILVLDDFGRRKGSDFVAQSLYGLLEHFWSEEKTLIVTSNFSATEAAANLSDNLANVSGILSRLLSGKQLEVAGRADHRAGTTA
jgi:DNA replication protein DnaC